MQIGLSLHKAMLVCLVCQSPHTYAMIRTGRWILGQSLCSLEHLHMLDSYVKKSCTTLALPAWSARAALDWTNMNLICDSYIEKFRGPDCTQELHHKEIYFGLKFKALPMGTCAKDLGIHWWAKSNWLEFDAKPGRHSNRGKMQSG